MSSAISGLGSIAATSTSDNALGDLSTQDFLKILLQEMSNQDPSDPADSGELLEQLSTLYNVESQLGLNQSLEEMVLQNQVATAGGLIGKEIEGVDSSNDSVSGLVTAVLVQNGSAILELDNGKSLPLGNVTRIDDAVE